MSWLYDHVGKPLFFRCDPEVAHELAVEALTLLGRVRPL